MTCQPGCPHNTTRPNQQRSILGLEIFAKYKEPALRDSRDNKLVAIWMFGYGLTCIKRRFLAQIGGHLKTTIGRGWVDYDLGSRNVRRKRLYNYNDIIRRLSVRSSVAHPRKVTTRQIKAAAKAKSNDD